MKASVEAKDKQAHQKAFYDENTTDNDDVSTTNYEINGNNGNGRRNSRRRKKLLTAEEEAHLGKLCALSLAKEILLNATNSIIIHRISRKVLRKNQCQKFSFKNCIVDLCFNCTKFCFNYPVVFCLLFFLIEFFIFCSGCRTQFMVRNKGHKGRGQRFIIHCLFYDFLYCNIKVL